MPRRHRLLLRSLALSTVLLLPPYRAAASATSSYESIHRAPPRPTDSGRRSGGNRLLLVRDRPHPAAELVRSVRRGGSQVPAPEVTSSSVSVAAPVEVVASSSSAEPTASAPTAPGGSDAAAAAAAAMTEEKGGGGGGAGAGAGAGGGGVGGVVELPPAVKLLIGAGGIYAAFLYYGSLQEDVFRYEAVDGSRFKQAWFLQVLEALANVIVGFGGMRLTGPTGGIPKRMFAVSGASQVSAKACTSLALANGLSFPVATLAKSGKMAPVMAGSLLLGGATYSSREYLQVAAIIGGTAIVSMGKKKGGGGSSSSALGVFYIVMSLVMDGVTAGFQKRLKAETAKAGVKPKPYDFMFWTNLYMCLTAAVVALALGELTSGMSFCTYNPEIYTKIIKFALCSAVGQSFIFYTIANFDPLVLSTVTTTRKIFSVLLSIFLKGHSLSAVGWGGIALACGGILSEMQAKASGKKKPHGH